VSDVSKYRRALILSVKSQEEIFFLGGEGFLILDLKALQFFEPSG
jgi:hypothetical protein